MIGKGGEVTYSSCVIWSVLVLSGDSQCHVEFPNGQEDFLNVQEGFNNCDIANRDNFITWEKSRSSGLTCV